MSDSFDSMDSILPGSSVHGISQARILESVAISSSRGSFPLGIKLASLVFPVLAGSFFTTKPEGYNRFLNNMPEGIIGFLNYHRYLRDNQEVGQG